MAKNVAKAKGRPAETSLVRGRAVLDTDKHDAPETDSSSWSERDVNEWSVAMTGERNTRRDGRVAKARTLRHDAVRPVLRRNEEGEVTGYSTTDSIIVKDWNRQGREFYAVIPRVFSDDAKSEPTVHSEAEALERYKKTGDSWGGMYSYEDASRLARAVHENHSRRYNRDWNAYLATEPLDNLAPELRSDPHLAYARKLVDAIYDRVRPEEGWDSGAVRVGGNYRIGPGLLGSRYVRGGNGFRQSVANAAEDVMDTDDEAGVYAAKNKIFDLVAARRSDGSGVSLFNPEEIPEAPGKDAITLGALGYHFGQSLPLNLDLGDDPTSTIARTLAERTKDGTLDVTGRRMREYEFLTGKPGVGLAEFTEDESLKEHIRHLARPGKGGYMDSPAYEQPNVRQDAKGGTSRRDADVAKEAEKIRGTRIRVEGDHGAVKGTVAEVADLAPAAQRGRIENAIEADAANRARRAEYDRLAAENRGLVGEAGLARYDELITKGRPDARSQTSDALAYALRDNPVLAPESRSNLPFSRPTHDKNGHPLTYVQDSKWVPDANPRTTRRESSADREFREATHVPTGVTIIGDQKFTTYADGTIGDTTAEHIREARESKALSEALLRQDAEVVPSFQKDYRYTDPLFTSDGQQRIKDIVGKTSPRPESGELTKEPNKLIPRWAPPDLNPKPYSPEARESEKILLRQDAKGGDAGGEVTENAEIVNSGEAADPPVTNGPRIVINPTTFRNGKDALCVAFNERFRIWMEAEGFNPQSEPTEKQREFFNDTAYADDELMLRRTILARIATLDTSVKDPTDAQITETLEMLKGFRETERPDDAWQANALDRIIGLVQSVEPAERATPRPT